MTYYYYYYYYYYVLEKLDAKIAAERAASGSGVTREQQLEADLKAAHTQIMDLSEQLSLAQTHVTEFKRIAAESEYALKSLVGFDSVHLVRACVRACVCTSKTL